MTSARSFIDLEDTNSVEASPGFVRDDVRHATCDVACDAGATGQAAGNRSQHADRYDRGDGTARALWLGMSNMTRLETIVDRQRRSRVRDLAFAALVVIAGTVSLMSVTQAVRSASVHVVAK
jgi:hypothetical protein